MPRPRVTTYYRADDGVVWLVFDWQVITGHRYPRMLGESGATHRGFLNRAGERRVYTFKGDTESRWPVPKFLEQQLRDAEVLQRTPHQEVST